MSKRANAEYEIDKIENVDNDVARIRGAVCCSVLQCVAVCCSVLQCVEERECRV